jgi:hypothetical protein
MLRLYSLLRPGVAFLEDSMAVVAIPAGALVKLTIPGDGRAVTLFSEDVDRHGRLVASDPKAAPVAPVPRPGGSRVV